MTSAIAEPDVVTGAIVFTDLVGFTEFTAIQGDDRAFELLSTQERIVRDRLSPGARVVKELGDGLLLWFPDATDAVLVTLALQDAFEAASEETGLPLWTRVGIHWGRPRRRGDDVIGHDVNLAARIMQSAGPGEVLVSEAAVDIARGTVGTDCAFEEIGPVVMKGIPAPVRLFRVERLSI